MYKVYNRETASRRPNPKEAMISISKSGVIRFNTQATESLALTVKTTVSFYQEEKDPFNWYAVFNDKNGLNIRINKEQATIYNKNIAEDLRACFKDIKDSAYNVGIDCQKVHIPVGPKPGLPAHKILIKK